jgi:hypothetical protein
MRWNSFWLACLIGFPFGAMAGATPQNRSIPSTNHLSPKLNASSFATELRRLQGVLEKNHASAQQLAAFRASLPAEWEVGTPERRYRISSRPLRSLLEGAERNSTEKAARIRESQEWLGELAGQVEGHAAGDSRKNLDASAMLEQILRRREFGAIRGPSAWDLLRQRVSAWILHVLDRLFHNISGHPIGAKVLFWFLLVAAVAWLAVSLFRFWIRRARFDELKAPAGVPAARSRQEWIRAALEAANRNDFREAIHAAYWAGITNLEDAQVIQRDRARTPREYLRQFSASSQAKAISQAKYREPLTVLTARVEQVWYGRRPASPEDFLDSLKQIEALGCQLQ